MKPEATLSPSTVGATLQSTKHRSGLEFSGSDEAHEQGGEHKKSIRSGLLQRRLALSPEEVNQKSEKICEALFALESYVRAKTIALYCPVKNEARTEAVFERSRRMGKDIYFPRVEGSSLIFAKISDLSELAPGKFQIPEPPRDSPPIPGQSLDIVIVPGVAFDQSGTRVGYGGGYYDRALGNVARERRVSLIYDFQLLAPLPPEPWDAPVGCLITESRTIFCFQRRMK
ncbi:MAG: 5-formyltetrahydrofolate cyclo-ligase [Deltaproteobacteria bacterium]